MHKLITIFVLLISIVRSKRIYDEIKLTEYADKFNHDISPCDDFYGHICSKINNTLNNRLLTHAILEYKDMAKQLAKTNLFIRTWERYSPFKMFIDSDFSEMLTDTAFVAKLNGEKDLEKFLNQTKLMAHYYGKSLNADNDKILSKDIFYLKYLYKTEYSALFKKLNARAKVTANEIKYHLFNIKLGRNTPKKGIKIFTDTHRRMVQNIKRKIKLTPWIINKNVLYEFLEKSNVQFHTNINGLQHSLDQLARFERNFKQCLTNYKLGHELVQNVFCLTKSVDYYHHEFMETLLDPLNAYNMKILNNGSFIAFNAMSYFMAEKLSIPEYMGLVGSVMGHEVSHTLFESRVGDYYSYYSNNVRQCVSDQYSSTASQYAKDWKLGEFNMGESGADLIGHRLNYEVMRELIGEDEMLQAFEGLPNLTNEQAAFYTTGLAYCTEESDIVKDSPHPPPNVRVNALINLQEFIDAFNCPANSQMMRTRTKPCYAFGENAPLTRKATPPDIDYDGIFIDD